MKPSHPSIPGNARAVAAGQRSLRWSFLGRVPYAPTYELQEQLRREIREGGPEHLLLLEHEPVFTLGRSASAADVVASRAWLDERGIEVHETNRGGQVTYHGPGQLVGYPIINLDPDRRDVRRYVRDLQEVLLRSLADFGIVGRRREGQALIGVWVGDEKIASIGVHLARWITLHGFALNVKTELEHFEGIVACGLPQVQMTSMQRLTGRELALAEIASRVAHHAGEVFERRLEHAAAARLWRDDSTSSPPGGDTP
ncbi:MAG: lipoyl(octanoyl) transferase LipB [Acidobacteriota bacterium]